MSNSSSPLQPPPAPTSNSSSNAKLPPPSSSKATAKSFFNTYFSAGLERNSRIASWMVAFIGAGIWIYYEQQKEIRQNNGPLFSIVDAKLWNDEVKNKTKNNKSATTTSTESNPKTDVVDCTDDHPKQHKQQ